MFGDPRKAEGDYLYQGNYKVKVASATSTLTQEKNLRFIIVR